MLMVYHYLVIPLGPQEGWLYKVLWNEGSLVSDALAGIDRAVADGVDILSISLSYRRTDLYENPIVIAGFGAREKGIFVSVSVGNRGPNFATLLMGLCSSIKDCRLVVCRVVITLSEARDVINYASNSDNTRASIDFQQTVVGIEPRAAPTLFGSSSTRPGRSYPRILKPDITAPKLLILAAYNPYSIEASIGNVLLARDYTLLSNTSMACPHISGIAALLKVAHLQWTPAAIQSDLKTTANPLHSTKKPIKDMAFDYRVATPLSIGAGHVDPNRSLDPGLVYDATVQDYVNLVCAMGYTLEQT
ncbi:hypothetical protein BUALT_Bualt08G0047900 [Buddleja alternifolia]|uniref:Peptidase S8/S53 domain-containing protein n=1 Tax=Buddleja alternifolia TaxID=168488 RepID=A0AAV6XER2_9LAMI|nr:hypothetical protein BUALT_Bualt08G0047900 [Buddleja alternifolia]